MKEEDFFRKYANMPINKRFEFINFSEYGLKTPHMIYEEIKELEETMRPARIKMKRLLKIASEFLSNSTS